MILDAQNLFSNNQKLLASAASTNVIDLGATKRNLGFGTKVPFLVQITEPFTGATSLAIDVQTSDTEDFSTVKTLASQTIQAADLKAGARFFLPVLPYGEYGRYLRLNYTVAGTGTAGAVTAGVTMGNDETYPYE